MRCPGLQRSGTRYTLEPDRHKAIALAIDEANSGDIVLIAGKGHEKVQVTNAGTVPFDDIEEATKALLAAGYGTAQGRRRIHEADAWPVPPNSCPPPATSIAPGWPAVTPSTRERFNPATCFSRCAASGSTAMIMWTLHSPRARLQR